MRRDEQRNGDGASAQQLILFLLTAKAKPAAALLFALFLLPLLLFFVSFPRRSLTVNVAGLCFVTVFLALEFKQRADRGCVFCWQVPWRWRWLDCLLASNSATEGLERPVDDMFNGFVKEIR